MTSQELLNEVRRLMAYDPKSGEFTRIVSSSSRARQGSTPGYIDTRGYRIICVFGRNYPAHRLAWLYVHGSMPTGLIDHKNRNPSDNRISNLRLATHKQNAENIKLRSDNTSGAAGVSWRADTSKWDAKIQHHGKTHHLGAFSTVLEASAAYESAATNLFTHAPTK